MPEWMRKQVSTKEGKAEYLKKYVADELFFRKGIKLEYDKSPELRKRLARVEKELVVNKVLKEEIKDKIKVEDDDLKNFFEAHKNKYVQKEAVKVSLIKAGMKEIAEKIAEELKTGKTFEAMAAEVSLDKQTAANKGKFKNWVRQGEDDLGIGSVDKVSKVLFSVEKGEITSSIEVDGYFYLFRIEEKRPEKVFPFEDVKERVGNDYFMQKLQSNYQSLLEQILKSSEVKLFPEVFEGGSA
jgi:peptidyl-prolyl cis-trans isomerase C